MIPARSERNQPTIRNEQSLFDSRFPQTLFPESIFPLSDKAAAEKAEQERLRQQAADIATAEKIAKVKVPPSFSVHSRYILCFVFSPNTLIQFRYARQSRELRIGHVESQKGGIGDPRIPACSQMNLRWSQIDPMRRQVILKGSSLNLGVSPSCNELSQQSTKNESIEPLL